MALVKCKECGKDISDQAASCPSCGAPAKTQPKQYGCGTLVVIGIVVLVFVGIFSSNDSSAPSKPQTPSEAQKPGEGTRIAIPSDSNAEYFILERGGTADKPTLVTKRIGPSGTSYSKRLFDCRTKTWMYLGDGDTLFDAKNSKPDAKMGPLVSGSIADVLWNEACRRK